MISGLFVLSISKRCDANLVSLVLDLTPRLDLCVSAQFSTSLFYFFLVFLFFIERIVDFSTTTTSTVFFRYMLEIIDS